MVHQIVSILSDPYACEVIWQFIKCAFERKGGRADWRILPFPSVAGMLHHLPRSGIKTILWGRWYALILGFWFWFGFLMEKLRCGAGSRVACLVSHSQWVAEPGWSLSLSESKTRTLPTAHCCLNFPFLS